MEFALEESFVPVWEILTSAWKMRSAISRIVLAAFVKGRDFSDVILLEGRNGSKVVPSTRDLRMI